ncbi:MAG: hypothetical protein ACRC7O_15645 [Fimbriiglobus sp.]
MDHVVDHAHGHGEGHDHAGHDHAGHDHAGHDHAGHDHAGHGHDHGAADYYLEQLLTVFVCGSFGVVAVLLPLLGRLDELLAPQFHTWVFSGGVLLLLFTAIRGVAIWSNVGKPDHGHHDHGHGHVHGPDCDHGHAHGDDDGHSHGNIFWRIVVLSFPLLLFCLGLPNSAFLNSYKQHRLGTDANLGMIGEVVAKDGTLELDFAALAATALDPEKRAVAEGMTTTIRGQFNPIGDREFTLYKMKQTCCAADMIPLKARILTNSVVIGYQPTAWVKVTGTVQFVEVPGKNQFLPVLRVKPGSGIEPTAPEA